MQNQANQDTTGTLGPNSGTVPAKPGHLEILLSRVCMKGAGAGQDTKSYHIIIVSW